MVSSGGGVLPSVLPSVTKGVASDWVAEVERGTLYDLVLATTPLEITTSSALGSGDELKVSFFTSSGDKAGFINIKFSKSLKYDIGECTADWVKFETSEEEEKTWLISKDEDSVTISCNGEEVVDFVFSESKKKGCEGTWSGEASQIKFAAVDTATVSFRAVDSFRQQPQGIALIPQGIALIPQGIALTPPLGGIALTPPLGGIALTPPLGGACRFSLTRPLAAVPARFYRPQ